VNPSSKAPNGLSSPPKESPVTTRRDATSPTSSYRSDCDLLCVFTGRGEDWPQFRGPGGRAVSETATPPIGFGPSSNLLWKVAIPFGVSSPVVAGELIFLTAGTEKKIETP
jgi:hypothetical protein